MSETKRCEVCDWPLAATMEEGCVEGNCSYRPREGTDEYFRIRKRREELAKRAAEPSPEVAPMQQQDGLFAEMIAALDMAEIGLVNCIPGPAYYAQTLHVIRWVMDRAKASLKEKKP